VKGTIGVRLALWYAGVFTASAVVLVLLTYALLASSLRQRDQQIVLSTLRDYAARYQSGGLPALVRAVEIEQQAGQREHLFVRVLGRGQDALFFTMPQEWGSFDVDSLDAGDGNGGIEEAPAIDRSAVLEVASARLWDGTVLQVGKSSENREEILERFRRIVLTLSIGVLAAGLAGGLIVTRSTLRPISALADVVRRITATGRTDERVPVGVSGDALDELSASFNVMLDRIGGLIAAMRDSLDNVAHDLRTPMARWRATAERALASDDPHVRREALADCLEESDRILAMLNTLMDISEAETGTLHLDLRPLSVAALAGEVVDLYEDVAEDRGVALKVDVPAELSVQADRERLRVALANLVDNGIKYSGPGGRVEIAARGDRAIVAIRVADNGVGISPADLPRIWDRLYRGDASRSERGLGLGLSLVRAYISAQHGTVDAESTPDVGSVFTVRLPAAPLDRQGTTGNSQ
jgi:signal transduction histidine kinase